MRKEKEMELNIFQNLKQTIEEKINVQDFINDLVHFFKTGDADDLCIKMIELLSTPPPVYSIEKLISKSDGNIALLGDSLFEIINTVINESKGKIYEQNLREACNRQQINKRLYI